MDKNHSLNLKDIFNTINLQVSEKELDLSQLSLNTISIHTISNLWDFFVYGKKYLSIVEFKKLKQIFTKVSNGQKFNLFVDYQKPIDDPKFYSDYYPLVVSNLANLNQVLLEQSVSFEDPILKINLNQSFILDMVDQNVSDTIAAEYQKLGFKLPQVKFYFDQEFETAVRNDFQNKKNLESAQAVKYLQDNMVVEEKKPLKTNFRRSATVKGKKIPIIEINEPEQVVVVEGKIFKKDERVLNNKSTLVTMEIYDGTSSITIKKFLKDQEIDSFHDLSEGNWIQVRGKVTDDSYLHDLVINIYEFKKISDPFPHTDDYPDEKRIELHLHTNMSQMDGITSVSKFAKRVAAYGQKGFAVTDHADVQAFPEAAKAAKANNLKLIYGVEINLVDDYTPIIYQTSNKNIQDVSFVVFDIETTGLSVNFSKIIEIGAVKFANGKKVAEFKDFIKINEPLSEFTKNLTSITDDDLNNGREHDQVLRDFHDFIEGSTLVGHNVKFDWDFIDHDFVQMGLSTVNEPVIDTMGMGRFLYPELSNVRLETLAKRVSLTLRHHHRAIGDAEDTYEIFFKMLAEFSDKYSLNTLKDLDRHLELDRTYRQARPHHATLLAQTKAGLKNLFKIVSESHLNYFYRVPRVPRSILNKYRSGILVGSACDQGEVFDTAFLKDNDETIKVAQFYDYLEIQPLANYQPLLKNNRIKDFELKNVLKKIVKIGSDLKIPVVATGDVHYLDPEDFKFREVLLGSQSITAKKSFSLPDLPLRTTKDMLAQFDFLDEKVAKEIVIKNSNRIFDLIEEMSPLKDRLYPPTIKGVGDLVRKAAETKMKRIYGENPPELVTDRLKLELDSVINNGFAVIYYISRELVRKSNKDGYLVGSRGSIGSSFAATMLDITEVNPLPPHYLCLNCHYSKFFTKGEYYSGYDLVEKDCPNCGNKLHRDGQDIPFATFLGFKGDKVPDIDLNFSGDYQPVAHNYIKVLFGENNAYRAGTIGTVAEKTAFGFVKAFERDREITIKRTEIDRLAQGITGVKRTTGQHPAGILIVPQDMDIYDFTPVQYPADKMDSAWKTTHFEFSSIHDSILKVDCLGHDDPTVIRMLQDLSGIDPVTIPTDDPNVMSLFSSPKALGVTKDEIFSNSGTLGIPEFGTAFVRGMLDETHPKNFSELLQISGLSHGTDVWRGNAEDLIAKKNISLAKVIGCRDNIMLDLIHWDVEPGIAFKIMEAVRKGKGISPDFEKLLKNNPNVPSWYIESCQKIKYMFPKAHAAAYVLMALRIAYFKVYFPIMYYDVFFSIRTKDYDIDAMVSGKEALRDKMNEVNNKIKNNEATANDRSSLVALEIANESVCRGINYKMVDLYKSDAFHFKIMDDNTLLAPFVSIPGLGDNVAKQIILARSDHPFTSKKDLIKRGKVSKTIMEYLDKKHVTSDLPDDDQLSLF